MAKEEYNKKEIKIEKCARCAIILIIVAQLVFTIAIFILMQLSQYVYMNTKLYNWTALIYHVNQFVILIVLFFLYTFYTLKMLFVMHRKHDLAFRIHSPRQIPLILITMASLLFVMYHMFPVVVLFFCQDVLHGFPGSFCKREAIIVFKREFINTTIGVRILPIIGFLLLNWPHDCYRCLGKDPDRTFSIH